MNKTICYGCAKAGHIVAKCPDVATNKDHPDDDVTQMCVVGSQAVEAVPVKSQLGSVNPVVVDVDSVFPRLVGQHGDVTTVARQSTDRTAAGLQTLPREQWTSQKFKRTHERGRRQGDQFAGRSTPRRRGAGAKQQKQQQQQQHQQQSAEGVADRKIPSPPWYAGVADMSVVCGDLREFYAHQSVLAAGSSHFREELRGKVVQHPIVFLPAEIGGPEFEAIWEYIYTGQACVSRERLQAFMNGARYLGIKDLAVDCGKSPHAQSQSSWRPEEESSCGDQMPSSERSMKVLDTYSVDCGKGPQHVSGDALSQSSWRPEDNSIGGRQQLTAVHGQELAQVGQDSSQDSDQDTATEPDSSSDEDDYIQDVVPAAMPRRRRRVRQDYLGPVCPNRLRQRQ